MAIIMAMIIVSMEVLQKSKGQWCPCRCGEGNDIDIGVLHSAEQVQVNAYMDIDIDSAGRTSEICWLVFLFKPSNLRSERWRRAAVMNFMADGTRLEMFCISPCQSDLERNRKIFATDLNIQFMYLRGACIFEGLTLILLHILDQECLRRLLAAGCSQHCHGGEDRGPVLPNCLPASQDHIQLFPESKPIISLRRSSQYIKYLCFLINSKYIGSLFIGN